MDRRDISDIKYDMLFSIFGICICDHEEVIICDKPDFQGVRLVPSLQKDIQIGILNRKEPWRFRGSYDKYDLLEEAVRMLRNIDNSETFTISSERWPILTQRRPFIRSLERRVNIFLKQRRYLPDFVNFKIEEVNTPDDCKHIISLMGNDAFVERVMDRNDLGREYYPRLVFVLLSLFEDALKVQKKIDKERQGEQMKENEKLILSILGPTYYYTPMAGSWNFEVLPSVILSDLSLKYIQSAIQSHMFIPDIDIKALEHNINREFKKCYNRFENCHIDVIGFTGNYILNIRFQGLAFNKSIDGDMLYYYIIHILDELICKANEMEATAEMKAELIRIQLNNIYGLGADLDGDACVVMHRGRGLSKSLAQIKALNDLRKNGVSKIQIAPGKKLENLHEDILDSFRYLYDFGFMNDCTARAIVRYCEADAKATMEAALAMKENNKQVVLEQLEEEDPQVPMKIFESLVTGSLNGESEILIGADISNKEDKTMMIPVVRRPEIKEIIFNEPATIVFWKDGTKTIVKCGEGEKYDPEKGVAIALAKKMLYSKDYSRVIASGDDWKRIKAERRKAEAKKRAAAKKKALKKAEAEKAKKTVTKKAPAKKKPMPKLPVNVNVTKTSTVKKTAKRTK